VEAHSVPQTVRGGVPEKRGKGINKGKDGGKGRKEGREEEAKERMEEERRKGGRREGEGGKQGGRERRKEKEGWPPPFLRSDCPPHDYSDCASTLFSPRCMECRRGLAMRILSVYLSVRLSVCQTRDL